VGACGPLHPRDDFEWGAPGGMNLRIPLPAYPYLRYAPCGSGVVTTWPQSVRCSAHIYPTAHSSTKWFPSTPAYRRRSFSSIPRTGPPLRGFNSRVLSMPTSAVPPRVQW
jgi:hypothetical protein